MTVERPVPVVVEVDGRDIGLVVEGNVRGVFDRQYLRSWVTLSLIVVRVTADPAFWRGLRRAGRDPQQLRLRRMHHLYGQRLRHRRRSR